MEFFTTKQENNRTRNWFLPTTLASEVSNFPEIRVPKGTNGMFVRSQNDGIGDEVVAYVYLLEPFPEIGSEWDNILDVYIDPDMPAADITANLIYPNGRSAARWIRDYYANIGAHMLNFIPTRLHGDMKRWTDFQTTTCNYRALGFLTDSILHPSIPLPLNDAQKMEIFAEVMASGLHLKWFDKMSRWYWRTTIQDPHEIRAASKYDIQLWVGIPGVVISRLG